MKGMNKPELTVLDKGHLFKVLQVTAKAGMTMPTHHATGEAVIIVEEGEGLLKMPEGNQVLKQGTPFIIPSEVKHSLEIQKDFKAIVVMSVQAEIEFQDNPELNV